jgi:hypothetical protein
MLILKESIAEVTLQFSYSDPGVIPLLIKRRNAETKQECAERAERKKRSCAAIVAEPHGVVKSRSNVSTYIHRRNGAIVINPTRNCSLAQFVEELEVAGYEIISAFYQERIDAENRRKTYHMTRFVFIRREAVRFSNEFQKGRVAANRRELFEICKTALWRVRAFLNPAYRNGEEILGQHAVSINLEVRQPLSHSDGKPVLVRRKDATGSGVGGLLLPLAPDYYLRVVGGVIGLVGS